MPARSSDPTAEPTPLLRPEEAAAHCGMPLRRFKKHVLDGDIPYVEFGERTKRYRLEDIDTFIAERMVVKPRRETRKH